MFPGGFISMKLQSTLFLSLFLSVSIFAQNITNTLGTGGVFSIKDATSTFFSLDQSNGTISLIAPSSGSQQGSIFKGTNRFIHTFRASGTIGSNTFIGISSGNFSMSGTTSSQASYNTGVGHNSLTTLTTGSRNSAFGYASLDNNTSGNENCGFGILTLTNNDIGTSNSAFGASALGANTSGNANSALGFYSLGGNTTGNYNTALGYYAGSDITTGSNNIAIGNNAQVPTATADNQIRLGNTSITYAGVQVAWTVTSDLRLKENIENSPLGLHFISKLRPVSYIRNNDEKKRTEFGLIAQEVEEALKSEGMENTGMLTITDHGEYQLRYNDLIAPLIKAIQELKEENKRLTTEINSVRTNSEKEFVTLRQDNVELRERLAQFEQLQEMLLKEVANLKEQNNDETRPFRAIFSE